ncbi:MIF4G domain containing protein [Histomonas meleagridis]|uniref:MIF4G domain containing protein n=1 Tax=Histomonas meleagridis TaxID=135588 RepID=UPI00355A885C|nr:MIF4G domain containing protein [Histomonas meleagridis]KAH0797061.1 MIF4G domain containing protein [Histomonas meleagridis]
MLMNYVYECNSTQGKSQSGKKGKSNKKGWGYSKPPRSTSAELVVMNANRFTTSQYEKNTGYYDENSDEAFKATVNQTMNRLTKSNVDDTVSEIAKIVQANQNNIPRIDYIVTTLVEKASKEHFFSDLYADFTSKCKMLTERIIEKTTNLFFDIIANPGTEGDAFSSATCIGSSAFFGALSNKSIIKEESIIQSAFKVIDSILKELKNPKSEKVSNLVEMMKSFFSHGGPNVTKLVNDKAPEIWELFERAKTSKNLKKRLYFFFVDVSEKKDEWLTGKVNSRNEIMPTNSNEDISLVNNLYANYEDSNEAEQISIPISNFLLASMDLYPDQHQNHIHFSGFVAKTLVLNKAKSNDVKKTLLISIQKYNDNSVINDCPMIWINVSDLINEFLLNKLISLNDAREIHKKYPKCKNYDPFNSMKWYIDDNYDFCDAVELGNDWPQEIKDALRMPKTILEHPNELMMSKLIAVALIRSIVEYLGDNAINLKAYDEWKKLINLALQKEEKIVVREIESCISMYDLPFTVDEFCAHFK